ncbi:MAG TPA: A24 family peptidase [Alphaproteobacteria bacterium]|nr:A24 family peptidase [Alphaproteobacteria bacterium]
MTVATLLAPASVAVLAATCIAAAVCDLRAYIIPNRLPLILALAFAGYAAATPEIGWLGHLLTGAAAFAAGALLFARGWIGGGDVKLFAALALWAGPARISDTILVMSLSGAAAALALLAWRARRAAAPEAGPPLAQPMPYGIALAAAGLWLAADLLVPR